MLFKKEKMFIWKNSQIQIMKILKLILIIISAFKILDYDEDADEIICTVDVSKENWEENLMQMK